MSRFLLSSVVLICFVTAARAVEAPYVTLDENLKITKLDSSPDESFLAVECDSMGRLFVGGREALFVYDVNPDGSFAPRKELFRFPPDSWVYNIVVRGHDLYVLTSNALYLIPDAVVKREGLAPKRLVWGLPHAHVHQCYHGMTIGPDGDIYFASGDPLWYYGDFERPDHWGHWTIYSQPEGTKIPFTGVGGVFRVKPDGSNFQVVATGLRNSCGLAFDHDWNLFTNDNDHEGMPSIYVPGRLVHVTPHAYFNWPRGWLLSKSPDRADMLETMNDHLGRYVPVGQIYYDDPYLGDAYRNSSMVASWGARSVTYYPLEHRGASFKAEEKTLLEAHDLARPVNLCVGRAGRLFVTIAYMPQNESSPRYPSDLIVVERKDSSGTPPFVPVDMTQVDDQQLFDDLGNEAWSTQYAAHIELMRRGGSVFADALRYLTTERGLGADHQSHLMWLAAAGRSTQAKDFLVAKVQSDTPAPIRLQALRALVEFYPAELSREMLVGLLKDADPQIQLAAMWGLFAREGDCPREVVDGPARSDDTYLRQAATMLMAERLSLEELRLLSESPDTATRLAAVVAAGFRLTIPKLHEPLDPAIKLDALLGNHGYEVAYAGETVDLRKLAPIGNFTFADAWKQAQHTPEQEALFMLLTRRLTDTDKRTQLQAAHFLYMLNDPRSEPQVAAVFAADEERRLNIKSPKNVIEVWIAGPFDDHGEGFKRVHAPQEDVVDLAATYREGDRELKWQKEQTKRQFVFSNIVGPYKDASVYSYFKLASGSKQRAQLLVGSDDGVQVWHNGKLVWTKDVRRTAQPYEDVVNLQLEAGSNDILVRTRSIAGQTQLYISYKGLQAVEPIAPDKVDTASLAERLASSGSGSYTVPPEFLKINWSEYIKEGDPEQGRKLFETIGCAKCHAATTDSTVVGGPSLAEAVKRFTVPNMVESVLLPSQQISPVFRSTSILTLDGRQLVGLVISETGDKVELLLPDTNKISIAKADIDEREVMNLSPMPPGIVKKPEELRDLLAYLLRKS